MGCKSENEKQTKKFVYTITNNEGLCGIKVYEKDKEIRCYPDIFKSETDAEHFSDICTRLQPNIIHFDEMVEDLLS